MKEKRRRSGRAWKPPTEWTKHERLGDKWSFLSPGCLYDIAVTETLTKKQASAVLEAVKRAYALGQQAKAEEICDALGLRRP